MNDVIAGAGVERVDIISAERVIAVAAGNDVGVNYADGIIARSGVDDGPLSGSVTEDADASVPGALEMVAELKR